MPGRMSHAEDVLKKNTFIISFSGYTFKVMVIFLEQDINIKKFFCITDLFEHLIKS